MKKVLTLLGCGILVGMVSMLVPQDANAGTCTITNLPSSGTLTSSRLNALMAQVETCINGNLGDSNWDSSDKLSVSNVANDEGRFTIPLQLACGSKTSAYMFQVPATSVLTDATFRCRDCAAADHTIDIQVGGTTEITFPNQPDSTLVESTGNSVSVSTSQNVEIDTTQVTAGSCSAYDVTLSFKTQHTS